MASTAIVSGGDVRVAGMRCSATGIEVPREVTLERGLAALRELGVVERGSRWAIGDLLLELGKRYGETYTAAIEATGYQLQTLKNFAWVSRRVAPDVRRADLQWGHHKAIAKLERDEQVEWLARAADEGWTSDELTRELRREADDEGDDFPNPEGTCRCPRCRFEGPEADFRC